MIPKKKFKKIEKDFKELRDKFSRKEIDKLIKSFYNIKNHGNIYRAKIKEAEENISEKSGKFVIIGILKILILNVNHCLY